MNTCYYQPDETIPAYKNTRPGKDAGYDLYASEDTWFFPFQTKTIPSNIRVHIPRKHLGRVTSRSGHASKGWLVHPGTVDHGYNGVIGIIQTNLSFLPRKVKKGTRIAQLIFMPFSEFTLRKERTLQSYKGFVLMDSQSNRDETGFGDSGIQ